MTQVCKFNQASTGDRTNIAIALQVIVQKTSTIIGQKGQQIVSVKQSNTTKANAAFVVQILKQSFGQGASDENDNEINDQSAIESRAEAANVLPDFTPLMNKIQNVEPSPSTLRKPMAPPCADTMARATEGPIPVPAMPLPGAFAR